MVMTALRLHPAFPNAEKGLNEMMSTTVGSRDTESGAVEWLAGRTRERQAYGVDTQRCVQIT